MKKRFIQKNAAHPGEILWEFYMEPINLTVTELAKRMSIARPNLSAIINGKAGISPLMAIKLSKALKTSVQFWINLQTNYELSKALNNKDAYKNIKPLV